MVEVSENAGKGGHYSTMTTLGKVGSYNFQRQKSIDEILDARRQETGHMLFHQLDDEGRKRHAEYEERFNQFKHLYNRGYTLAEISKKMNLSGRTLKNNRYLSRLRKEN